MPLPPLTKLQHSFIPMTFTRSCLPSRSNVNLKQNRKEVLQQVLALGLCLISVVGPKKKTRPYNRKHNQIWTTHMRCNVLSYQCTSFKFDKANTKHRNILNFTHPRKRGRIFSFLYFVTDKLCIGSC